MPASNVFYILLGKESARQMKTEKVKSEERMEIKQVCACSAREWYFPLFMLEILLNFRCSIRTEGE